MPARSAIPLRLLAVLISGLPVAACSTGGATSSGGQVVVAGADLAPLVATGVSRETPANVSVGPTVAGMTKFGYDLYRQIAAPDRNIVLSPLSLDTAWGMARAGAAGTTADQLDRIFGFPPDGPHAALNALTSDLVTIEGAPPTTTPSRGTSDGAEPAAPLVAIANGLFVQHRLPVKEAFLRTLAKQYGAGMTGIDFTSPRAKALIDAWVKEHTAGRITKLFDEIPENTRLVLANAVYFKGDWVNRFDKAQPARFTKADGSTVQADMMHVLAPDLGFAGGNGWQAVELPYADSDLSMLVMIPTDGSDPGALLDPAVLAQVRAELRPQEVGLFLPKWDFGSTTELLKPLKKLGLTALDEFPGISDRGLYVDQAIHRANIAVDESGTEAAAVTGIAFRVCAGCGPPIARADHPFAFAIVHKPTGTPLFIGQVADPTVG
ncbi:MAG: serpin family protein [Actinomycetes bacterium]